MISYRSLGRYTNARKKRIVLNSKLKSTFSVVKLLRNVVINLLVILVEITIFNNISFYTIETIIYRTIIERSRTKR